jgi:hypothetical protein
VFEAVTQASLPAVPVPLPSAKPEDAAVTVQLDPSVQVCPFTVVAGLAREAFATG